jgi:hypothetical protein
LGSYQAINNSSLAIIGKSLGHGDGSAATAIYARLQLDPVRASVNAAATAILSAGIRKTRDSANVSNTIAGREQPTPK